LLIVGYKSISPFMNVLKLSGSLTTLYNENKFKRRAATMLDVLQPKMMIQVDQVK
jgi:hypothetical protein